MYVTEDTTRADPETLRRLYSTAIRAGRVARLHRRHRRPRDAGGRGGGRALRRRRSSRSAAAESGSTGTAIAIATWRSINSLAALEAGATRLHGAGDRHRRARRQHADGHAARQPGADGLHRARPVGARRVLRGGLGGDRRADSAELSGRRARRVPHRHRRPRGGRDQGVPEEGPGARRRRLFGRAREPGRPRAGDRGRPDVGQVERRLLAGEARAAGDRRDRRADLREGEGVVERARGGGDPELCDDQRAPAASNGREVPRRASGSETLENTWSATRFTTCIELATALVTCSA